MINVTVLPMIDSPLIVLTPVDKSMNEKLGKVAANLQSHLHRTFTNERYEDVVIYLRFTTKYAVEWKIVNDVPKQIQVEVARCCTDLGYSHWNEP